MKRPYLIAFGVYLLIAILITYPLILNLSSVLVGYVHGDAYEMAHHIWWFKYALQNGLDPFYVSNLAYPDGLVGVTLWANPLQFFPAWLFAFVLPIPAAANVTLLLTMALNGLSMFWLAKDLTTPHPPTPSPKGEGETSAASGGEAKATPSKRVDSFNSVLSPQSSALSFFPAFLAGLIFMLYPTMQGHLGAGHAGLLVQWGVPIYIYGLFHLKDSRRWIPLTALGFVLSAAGHTLQLIYVVLPLTAVFALGYLIRRDRLALFRLIAACVMGGVVALILALPVARATFNTTAFEQTGDTVRYSADLLGVVTPSFNHPLFDQFEVTHRVLGINLDEGAAYIGVVAAILCVIALVRVQWARQWGWIALLAWVLSLGVLLKVFDQPVMINADAYRSYIPLPFALIANLPIFNLARTPGRFNFLVGTAIAIMAGYGAVIVYRWVKQPLVRGGVFGLMSLLIIFEYQTFFPLPTISADIPAGINALADRDDVRAIFSAPWDNLIAAKTDLYWQTAHHLPLIAGQVTRQTPVDPAKLTLLQTFDPALLNHEGADMVLIHRAYDDGSLERSAREQLGDPFYEDGQIALFDTPDPINPPRFQLILPHVEQIENPVDVSLYAPESGWAWFNAALNGTDRDVVLLLDDVPMHRWYIDGETAIRVPLPVNGYHTVRLALDPPCPINTDPALACRKVDLAAPNIEFTPADHGTGTDFERGITLNESYIRQTLEIDDSLPVWLIWNFAQARNENEIRYVHVIDESGALVGQQDNTLGVQSAGSAWAEEVIINFENVLPQGEYRVVVGWYTYPTIDPFCVLDGSDVCTDQNEVLIGTFRVE